MSAMVQPSVDLCSCNIFINFSSCSTLSQEEIMTRKVSPELKICVSKLQVTGIVRYLVSPGQMELAFLFQVATPRSVVAKISFAYPVYHQK